LKEDAVKTRAIIVITILFVVICLGAYAGFHFKNKFNTGPPEKITVLVTIQTYNKKGTSHEDEQSSYCG
jgi:hypothetical protein